MNLYLIKQPNLICYLSLRSLFLWGTGLLIALTGFKLEAQSANPRVEEVEGQVTRFDETTGGFVQVEAGYEITQATFLGAGENSSLIISFPGKVAARLSENSRAIFKPEESRRYEVELEVGTVSVLLDPTRDPKVDPVFAIRTDDGVVEAKGTFYAITLYEGQTYTSVKRGKVYKKEIPPTMNDFAAYTRRPKDEDEDQLAQAETSEEE